MSKSQQPVTPTPYDDEIDGREVFRVLWESKWLIGGITFASALVAVIIVLLLPNIYRAEALLAPNGEDGASGLGALAAQYGGLASLAGINFGSSSTDKTGIGLEILKSRRFVSEFIERHNLLVPLMAAKKWDSGTGKLIIDPDDYDVVGNKWVRDVRPPKQTVPSLQEAYDKFRDILTVHEDQKTGLVTLAIEHYSPTVAKQWVDWLIEDLNLSIMQQDVDDAEQAIEYLNKQIETTSLADLNAVFFSLIEEQTKTVMLAKVTDEYLLKTLDPAVAPEEKSKPRRSLIVFLGTACGLLFAMSIVLVRSSIRVTR